MQDLKVAITVPADGLAPNGARPSAGAVLITICNVSFLIHDPGNIFANQVMSFKIAKETPQNPIVL